MKPTVLIVEDDQNLRLTLQDNLEEQGYSVRAASTVAQAWKEFEQASIDVVVLDLMLPDGDGYAFCKTLRQKRATCRVLMLTARSLEEDLVRGFDAGADDYLAKPYRLRELFARIAALVRRPAQDDSKSRTHRFGPFSVDMTGRQLNGPEGTVELTRKEFDLLILFLENPGRILNRDEILNRVWGDVVVDVHTVDNFVSSLKKKLKLPASSLKQFELRTVRGVGFRWINHD